MHVEPETHHAGRTVARRPVAPVVDPGARRWRAVALVAAACSSSSPTAAKKKAPKTTTSTTTTSTTAPPRRRPRRRARADGHHRRARGAHRHARPPPRRAPRRARPSGGALSATCDTQSPSFKLAGAGANSIQPFFTRVFYYYNQADKGVSVNYSPAGSSVGVTDIQQNTVNFGDSEIPIKTPATGTGREHPAGARRPRRRGLSYNLPGVSGGLKLDGPTLAGIYLGKITKWNDAAIAALNPGVNLPVHHHRAGAPGRLLGAGIRPRPVPHRHGRIGVDGLGGGDHAVDEVADHQRRRG